MLMGHAQVRVSVVKSYSRQILTDESQDALREGQDARVEQETEAVGSVLQRQHVNHGEEKAGLRNGSETWSRWILIGDGLQGDGLHTCGRQQGMRKF